MEYRILGSIEVLDPSGRKLPLGGAMQQSVLASLLLRAGQTVVLDRLVEELWDDPPATAARTVQAYVSRLRHELPKRAIESRPGGYVLRLDGDELDLDTFARGAEEGHAALAAGDHEHAARLLREALALWRGPALAGLTSEALRRYAEQLEEQRLSALEDRLEADLESARHSEIVPELTALVAEHPFRERLRAQLMRAFYRSGRPGEALALYRETRRLLVEELGMEPGQELRELEQAILRQDPELAEAHSPEPTGAATETAPIPLVERERLRSQGPAPTTASRYPRRRTIAFGALAGVIAAAVAIPLFALGGSGVDHADLGETPGNSVGVLDANSGDARAPVALPAPPTAVAAGRGLVWAASADSDAVYVIDPKTNTKLETIEVGNAPGGIAFGGGCVWVTNSLDGTVSQIDPDAQKELQRIPVGNGPTGVAVDEGGSVWVANTSDHTVSKIRASDGQPLENYSAGEDPGAIAVGEGAVWVASKSSDTVVKLDPRGEKS